MKNKLEQVIMKGTFKDRDNVKCRICNKKIKPKEKIVGVLTASFYASYKGFFVCHESCFLISLVDMFKYKIKLTKRMKDEIIAEKV